MGQDHSKSKEEKVQQKHVKGDAATSSDREAAHVDSRTDEAFRRLAAGDAYIHYKRLVVSFQIYSSFLVFLYNSSDSPVHMTTICKIHQKLGLGCREKSW